jgi:hypothetical protein
MTTSTDTQTIPVAIFTPRDPRGVQLSFPLSEIEILDGNLFKRGRGRRAGIRFDGVTYDVYGAACGLGCFCAATVVEVAAE